MITCSDVVLLKQIYNSLRTSIFDYYINKNAPNLGPKGLSMTKQVVEKFPVNLKSIEDISTAFNLNDVEKQFIIDYLK